jgi:uncharacterized protein YaaW (UPF0174 family)
VLVECTRGEGRLHRHVVTDVQDSLQREVQQQGQELAEMVAMQKQNESLHELIKSNTREIEQMMTTMQVLRRKLRAERQVRKASENWLQAELKSRVCCSTLQLPPQL